MCNSTSPNLTKYHAHIDNAQLSMKKCKNKFNNSIENVQIHGTYETESIY